MFLLSRPPFLVVLTLAGVTRWCLTRTAQAYDLAHRSIGLTVSERRPLTPALVPSRPPFLVVLLTATWQQMKKFEWAPAAPPQPGGGRSCMAHRPLREPRFGRRTAGFLCGASAPSAARFGSCAHKILWAHVYSGGAVAAMGGSPGFVGRMDAPWTCSLCWVVAVGICTITSSSLGSPTAREDQGRRGGPAVARRRPRTRARCLSLARRRAPA